MFMSKTLLLLSLPLVCFATETPHLGKPASPALVNAWNQDIFANGHGLPKGSGNAVMGKKVYERYCLSCHGVNGSGDSADELAGAQHTLTDNPPDKTIGTYWPYATTIFDFTRRSMPLNAPNSLSTDELYAVTAYLLYLNQLIDENDLITHKNLAKITLPNYQGFINQYNKD